MKCMCGLLPCLVVCLVYDGLVCAQTEHVEGDIRLVDGISNSNQGRVEIYHNGVWGTVCGRNWGWEEATVVCRQLYLGEVLLQKAFFGNGSGPIYVGADCHDHDFHIDDCHGYWEEVPTTCTHEDDVAVICYPEDHEEVVEGLTMWQELIIIIAFGISFMLFLKMVKFVEDSKVDVVGDDIALTEIKTDDHPYAASQHVSTADECHDPADTEAASASKQVDSASKSDDTTSAFEVTASENDVNKKELDVSDNETEGVQKHILRDKPNIQSADVSVQTVE
nr:scavenger receptor cysteine-rich type 1 protein M130-like [Lytechinus pictus]